MQIRHSGVLVKDVLSLNQHPLKSLPKLSKQRLCVISQERQLSAHLMSWLETRGPPSSLAGLILALETIKTDPDSFNLQNNHYTRLRHYSTTEGGGNRSSQISEGEENLDTHAIKNTTPSERSGRPEHRRKLKIQKNHRQQRDISYMESLMRKWIRAALPRN